MNPQTIRNGPDATVTKPTYHHPDVVILSRLICDFQKEHVCGPDPIELQLLLVSEIQRLRDLAVSMAERVAIQSDLLAKRAEVKSCPRSSQSLPIGFSPMQYQPSS
jgi:hypothetical protein